MTHEHTQGGEHAAGPEHDASLPDAWEIPVADGPFDLAPAVHEDEWDYGDGE